MIFGQKIIFFKATHLTAMKFGILIPKDDLVKMWASCGEICSVVFLWLFFVIFGEK